MNEIDNIKTAIDAGRLLALEARKSPLPNGVPYAVLKNADGSERFEHLSTAFDKAPGNIQRNAQFQDADSFARYVGEFSNPATKIYANLEKASFQAVLDDHHQQIGDGVPTTGWRQHRASFQAKPSIEWLLWTGQDGNVFDGNVKFAEFLEDAHFDLVTPSGADMLLIATTFKVHEDVTFKNAVRMQDGNPDFKFEKVVTGSAGAAGEMQIPETIEIEIPVYAGLNQPKYRLKARFRYRLKGSGKLDIWFEIERPHVVVQQAFTDIVTKIGGENNVPIYVGDAA